MSLLFLLSGGVAAPTGSGAGSLASVLAAAAGVVTNPNPAGTGAGILAKASAAASGTVTNPNPSGTGAGTLRKVTAFTPSQGTGNDSLTYLGLFIGIGIL